jgi:hypothetical protein
MTTRIPTLVIALLVASSVPVSAVAAGPIHLGVKAGLAISNVDAKEVNGAVVGELKNKKGPAGGVFATWELNEHFGAEGDLLYVSKGFSYGKGEAVDQSGNPLGTYENLQEMDYVAIPLLLRASWGTGGSISPALVVGPETAFKVRETFKQTGAVTNSRNTALFSTFDEGLAAGAEVRVRTGSGWSLIEARYTQGLVVHDLAGEDKRNRALTVMAGYSF